MIMKIMMMIMILMMMMTAIKWLISDEKLQNKQKLFT